MSPEYDIKTCSYRRNEFDLPEDTDGCGFIFLGSSPEIVDFIKQHPDADYVMISESEQLLRGLNMPEKLFYHDSEAIGRVGVEILLDMLEHDKKSAARYIPLINCSRGGLRESLIPEF